MNKDGEAANAGGTHYIKDGDQVAFDDGNFGFAAFDNAQVRHAMSSEPYKLVFAK
jgi:hypothetical protein